jgi:hypothetical protein
MSWEGPSTVQIYYKKGRDVLMSQVVWWSSGCASSSWTLGRGLVVHGAGWTHALVPCLGGGGLTCMHVCCGVGQDPHGRCIGWNLHVSNTGPTKVTTKHAT